jgi:hypothetical protein
MRKIVDMTSGKSIAGVSAVGLLVAFNDIPGKIGLVFFFYPRHHTRSN